jgi:hypothetical protein
MIRGVLTIAAILPWGAWQDWHGLFFLQIWGPIFVRHLVVHMMLSATEDRMGVKYRPLPKQMRHSIVPVPLQMVHGGSRRFGRSLLTFDCVMVTIKASEYLPINKILTQNAWSFISLNAYLFWHVGVLSGYLIFYRKVNTSYSWTSWRSQVMWACGKIMISPHWYMKSMVTWLVALS